MPKYTVLFVVSILVVLLANVLMNITGSLGWFWVTVPFMVVACVTIVPACDELGI